MGLAEGLGRPLLVFGEKETAIPSDLIGVAYVKAGLDDVEAVDFHLDTFLQHAGKSSAPFGPGVRPRRVEKADIRWARRVLHGLGVETKGAGIKFEQLVVRLLETAGALVSPGPGKVEDVVDMAVWIDGLQATIGNPLIAQVKLGTMTDDRLRKAELQILSYFPRVHARAGLLIYHDPDNPKLARRQPVFPFVFDFSARELIDLVSRGALVSEIIRKRNEQMHGPR
jgi:hypothetical protein